MPLRLNITNKFNVMKAENTNLQSQPTEVGSHDFVKKLENPKDAFAYYFSTLNIDGIDSILSNQNFYDGVSKQHYVNLIKKHFISLKTEGIMSLKAISGICHGCEKGCSGFTFLDENNGFYMDFIIEVENSEIVNFMECFNLINETDVPNKIEHVVIKPFDFDSSQDEVPF